MGRSILAVFAGYITEWFLVIPANLLYSRINPNAFSSGALVGSAAAVVLIYVQPINVISGYITGRVAPRNPVQHALILGFAGLVLCVDSAWDHWGLEPHCYLLGTMLLAIPSTVLGGYFARRPQASKAVPA